jgi:hypothetical protein
MVGGKRVIGWAAGTVALALTGAPGASAATIVVDDGADRSDAAGCTLRKAIRAANADAARGACRAGNGGDTIKLAVASVTLAVPGPGEDDGATGDLDATSTITIAGLAVGGTTVDAAGIDRVLDVRPGATVVAQDVTLTGGATPPGRDAPDGSGTIFARGGSAEGGGGIRNAGSLTLRRAAVSGNATGRGGAGGSSRGGFAEGSDGGTGGNGGGILSSGTLTLAQSRVSDNVAGPGGAGGDAFGDDGVASLPFGRNGDGGSGSGGGEGGGIRTDGTITIVDSTISGNRAGAGGPGGSAHGGAGWSTSTADGGPGGSALGGSGGWGGDGGGVLDVDGRVTIRRSLVAGNAAGSGAPGGNAYGGGGGNGQIAGSGTGAGGAGGHGWAGYGGSGGDGGGIYAALDYNGDPLVATSTTIAGNTAGAGGAGGTGLGAPGGRSNAAAGGDGGDGHGGAGGAGGSGGGLDQPRYPTSPVSRVIGDTVAHNAAGAPGAGGAGFGGFGNSGSPAGQDGESKAGSAGSPGRGGGVDEGNTADSIIWGNTPDDCANLNASSWPHGHNVFGTSGCYGGTFADPQLGPLADNGGPTFTMAIPATSPAAGAVPVSGADCPDTDQRGVGRPQGSACDAGAYERAPPNVASESATDITRTGVRLAARVNPHTLAAQAHFAWNRPGQPPRSTPTVSIGAGHGETSVAATLSGLAPDTSYVYRVVVTNVDGTTKGTQQSFTTKP